MKRGLPVRRSRVAAWARLVGALAVPVLTVGALGSRLGIVPGAALIPVLILGFALGLLALALAAYALADIWRSGAQGAGAAIAAVVYALPVLAVLAGIAAAAVVYPPVSDVSTDVADPPPIEGRPAAPGEPSATGALPTGTEAYRDIAPRIYGLPMASVFAAARSVVEDKGWVTVKEVPPLSMPKVAETAPGKIEAEPVDAVLKAKAIMTQSRAEAARPAAPVAEAPPPPPDRARLQAVASTLIFGFSDDVVVEFAEVPEGTRVDMRSASRVGQHDLGQNARRIRGFFAALDVALQPDPNETPPAAVATPAPAAQAGSGGVVEPPPEEAPAAGQ